MVEVNMIKKALHEFDETKYHPSTVIGEFSGRDSVAAIMKAFESEDINYILPVASFAGSEYGDYDEIYNNYKKIIEIVEKRYGKSKVLYPLHEYNREDLWHLMNGRFMAQVTKKFGYMTPCIGCHLYFHLIKLNFAKALSNKVISGERESHDGKIKINQYSLSLDAYIRVMDYFDVELLMPIRNIKDGKVIEDLIGFPWVEGKNHPKCVLSGNYRNSTGQAILNVDELQNYLENHLIVLGQVVGEHLLDQKRSLENLKERIQEI
jgi:hypothetical protein